MNHRKIIPFLFVGIVSFFFLIPGCDELVTEENTEIIYDTTLGEACFDCHSDEDNILLRPKNQYANSRHANDSLLDLPVVINGTDFVINSCAPQCHTHEGFIRSFDSVAISPTSYNVIYCYTCHMPHTGDYDTWDADTLRAVYEYILLANDSAFSMGISNMCAHCHQAASPAPLPDVTSDVTLTADFGPHYSGQADILSGKGGYRFTDNEIINSHELTDENSGCLICHYGTGQGYTFGEHTFRLEKISGVDTTHYVTNCISCHPSITNFYTVVEGLYNRIDSIASMADSLEILLKNRYYLDPDDPSGTQLMVDSVIPVNAARILYNYLLYKMEGSRGVHNPRFVETLLYESIIQFDNLPPAAMFSVSATAGCAPLEVDFTDESMGNIAFWEWDFGDGIGTSESADTSYTFTTAGSYEISLTVTDINTLEDTEIRTGYINVYSTVANFYSDDQSGCDSLDVTFYDNSPGEILTWDWDFGDGSPHEFVKNPNHTYTDIGTFDVTLLVTDSCGSDDTTMTTYITIADAAPVAAFRASETTGTLPKTINFTDESTGLITSWSWDFGDGGTSDEQNPSYTYDNEAGTFTVILSVSNDCGSSQEIKTDYITITE